MLILKKLRTEKGISLDKLSTDLNINKSTLSRIENGLREPKESFIKDCSDYFGVSTDYLIGKINIDDSNKLTKCLNSTFPIRLKELRKKKELTQAELSKLLNCSLSKIAMLETSKREPVKEDLLRISEFFNVSVDYLLGKTLIENYTTTNEISKIIKSYESLPKEAQEHINSYIEFLVDRYKKWIFRAVHSCSLYIKKQHIHSFYRGISMNKLDALLDLANNEEIEIYYTDKIADDIKGLYINRQGLKIISLLNSLKQNNAKLIEILAEELGHHFTSVGNYVSSKNSYKNKILIDKTENKALKWACEFLITEEEIIHVINSHATSVYEIAEELQVSINFLLKRLEFLSKKKSMLDLGNNRFLVLTNLPNFYIYEDIF